MTRYPMDEGRLVVEQLSALVEQARSLFHESGDAAGAIELSDEALEIATSVDAAQFLSLDAPSMGSFLELSNADDRVIAVVAEALEMQAEVADGSGLFVQASARREQAAAVRDLLSPMHEN